MVLFRSQGDLLTPIRENPFKLEREIQSLFEANLETIMSLKLVKSEFKIKNRRIDTLAFDATSKAFIIIEYKRDKNISVVDQGFSYLSLMLENKADFIVEYNENIIPVLKRDEIDWSQSRIIFVSTSFTENQVQATNFKDVPIELWEVKRFDDLIFVTSIKKSSSAVSIKPVAQQNQTFKKVTEEIKVFTEEDHTNQATEYISELYEKFKSAILNLNDGIEVNPQKYYIAFKKNNNFTYIEIQKKSLRITINLKFGQLDDSKEIAKDISNIGHRGYGDYLVQADDDSQIEYIMSLIKQAI